MLVMFVVMDIIIMFYETLVNSALKHNELFYYPYTSLGGSGVVTKKNVNAPQWCGPVVSLTIHDPLITWDKIHNTF